MQRSCSTGISGINSIILVLLLGAMAVGVAAPKGLGRSLTIALHQIAYGLVLIGSFSLGLASVLRTLGLAAVYGRQWLESFPMCNSIGFPSI